MEPTFIFIAVLIVVIIAVTGRHILAWDDRRTSDLKGIDFENAIERIHRLLPANYKRPFSIRITNQEGRFAHRFGGLMTISRYSLANLNDAELHFLLVNQAHYAKLMSRAYWANFLSLFIWLPLCNLVGSLLPGKHGLAAFIGPLMFSTFFAIKFLCEPKAILAADSAALKLTEDPISAKSVINKFDFDANPNQGLPTVEQRLEHIKIEQPTQ